MKIIKLKKTIITTFVGLSLASPSLQASTAETELFPENYIFSQSFLDDIYDAPEFYYGRRGAGMKNRMLRHLGSIGEVEINDIAYLPYLYKLLKFGEKHGFPIHNGRSITINEHGLINLRVVFSLRDPDGAPTAIPGTLLASLAEEPYSRCLSLLGRIHFNTCALEQLHIADALFRAGSQVTFGTIKPL